jgi:hypothetical protein
MALFNSIMSWVMKKRIHQIELFMKYPHEVQQELLESLLRRAGQTEYGKKFGFDSIRNHDQFKAKVPVVTYEELFPYIDKLIQGKQNVLWPTEIRWFARSSGTTNARSKYIPVSSEAIEDCHFKGGKDMLSIYFNNNPDSQLFTGKGLVITGSSQTNPYDETARSQFGDVSAVLLQNLPWWAQLAKTPSLDIALMGEWEKKIDKIVKTTSQENVTNLAGVPTWMVVLIERILEARKVDNLLEVWPNLEVFFHGAVSFTPYQDLFRKFIPSDQMHYMETYNASEGFFGIQDQTGINEMLLMLDYGIFYEFIPTDENGSENPQVLGLHEVELGKNYAVVITTNAGLWRYKIGDTVRFTSLSPYRIRISGRTRHFINAFGEELIIENAEEAIADACRKTHATIDNFTAGPHFLTEHGKGGHEWIIEFTHEPEDMERFGQILDEKLREINSDYDAKRYKDLALQPPIIHCAPSGTFYEWMRKRGKLGGQNKVPRLSNTREYLEDLLADMGR